MLSRPILSNVWRNEFKALEQDFRHAANAHCQLHHAVLQSLDGNVTIPPSLGRRMHRAGGFDKGEMRGSWGDPSQVQGPHLQNWIRMHGPAKFSYLYGPSVSRRIFKRLAERAWLALPGTTEGKKQAFPQNRPLERWMAFVYDWLSKYQPNCLKSDGILWVSWKTPEGRSHEERFARQWFRYKTPQGTMVEEGYPKTDHLPGPINRWLYSDLATDPFHASALAISLLLADPSAAGPFWVSRQEMDDYQNSPAFQNANFRVTAVILGGGKSFPIYRYSCKSMAGPNPSLCTNADEPATEADRQALLKFLPQVAQRFQELNLIKADQTVHWVGNQESLSAICSCNLNEIPNQQLDNLRPPHENPESGKNKSRKNLPEVRVDFSMWGLGYDPSTGWHVFNFRPTGWSYARKKLELPSGILRYMLSAILQERGILNQSTVYKFFDNTRIRPHKLNPYVSKLRSHILKGIGVVGRAPNLLKKTKGYSSWQLMIRIGQAEKMDPEFSGADPELSFIPCE